MDCCFDGHIVPLATCLFKQPTADKEEAGQPKQEKHIIPTHPHVSQTKAANMRIDDENHRKSSHRINIFYPLFGHYVCKDTEKKRNPWLFEYKNVPLQYEREIDMD